MQGGDTITPKVLPHRVSRRGTVTKNRTLRSRFRTSRAMRFRWWTGEDSNLRSPQGAADSQSAGFSHSPTRPHGGITRLEGYCALVKRRDTIPPVSQCRNPPPENKRESSPDSKFLWQSWRRDLNPRPSDYKSDALPTELRQHGSHRENITKGHENCKR